MQKQRTDDKTIERGDAKYLNQTQKSDISMVLYRYEDKSVADSDTQSFAPKTRQSQSKFPTQFEWTDHDEANMSPLQSPLRKVVPKDIEDDVSFSHMKSAKSAFEADG